MRTSALIIAAAGLGLAVLAPVSSQALPNAAPGVESNVVSAVCVRKSSGRLVCGYYDPNGNFHETGGDDDGYYEGPRGGGYYGGGYYEGRRGGSGCVCTEKSSGRVVCGIYDRFGGFHESKSCYRY
jgi:hypothetical protein